MGQVQVMPVVTPFPSPLFAGGAGAAGPSGTNGKSPSPSSSSCPTGRDGNDPRQRGCPHTEHPHPHLLSLPGSPRTSRDEGRDRLSGQTRKTCSRFVCVRRLHHVPLPVRTVLAQLSPTPRHVPEGWGGARVSEVTPVHQV